MRKYLIILSFCVLFSSCLYAQALPAEDIDYTIPPVQEDCYIVYGAHANYKPYEWVNEKGKVVGINIDLLDLLAQRADCSYEIDVYPWSDLMSYRFRHGDITMLSNEKPLTGSPRADEFRVQLQPVDVLFRYFITRKDSPDMLSMESLRDKTVLVVQNGVSDDYAESLKEEYSLTILKYTSIDDVLKDLSRGVGDVCFFNKNFVNDFLAMDEFQNLKVASIPVMPATMGFMLHQDNLKLYTKLDRVLTEIKTDGSYYKIMHKWADDPEKYGDIFGIILKAVIIVFFIVLFILLWNRTLHKQVSSKTKSLNDEIENRKTAEAKNVRLREEAFIASRMAALGQMAASVAHEINNPASLITYNMGYLSRFKDSLIAVGDKYLSESDKIGILDWNSAKNEAIRAEKVIYDSIKRISDTVKGLKEYGKVKDSDYRELNLCDCLESAVRLTGFFTKSYTQNLSVQTVAEPVLIYGNSLHIEECVINLIQNACHALKNKSGSIKCSVSRRDGYGIISVEDNGKGMSPEILERIWEPFFTTRGDAEGTGLGLSITSRIMKEHRGKVDVKSEPDKGTVVSLYFPLLRRTDG